MQAVRFAGRSSAPLKRTLYRRALPGPRIRSGVTRSSKVLHNFFLRTAHSTLSTQPYLHALRIFWIISPRIARAKILKSISLALWTFWKISLRVISSPAICIVTISGR